MLRSLWHSFFRRNGVSKQKLITRRILSLEPLEERMLLAALPTPTLNVSAHVLPQSNTAVFSASVVAASPNAATPAGTVTFTDTLADGTPEGSFQVKLGAAGVAEYDDSSLVAGVHVITAKYSGDGTYAPCVASVGPNSLITTVATPDIGDGGSAPAATLANPFGVAVDAAGDVFIVDANDYRVREVNQSTGVITTVAGNGVGSGGGDGGPATAASLGEPVAVAVDSATNCLFIVDQGANEVRQVNLSTGIISTVAGDNNSDGNGSGNGDGGQATAASLSSLTGIAVDSVTDCLYIADVQSNYYPDAYCNVVREVNLGTGIITTVAGNGVAGDSGDGGQATAASLSPEGLAVEDDAAGNFLFIADAGNNLIRQVNLSSGTITTVAGGGSNGLRRRHRPPQPRSTSRRAWRW